MTAEAPWAPSRALPRHRSRVGATLAVGLWVCLALPVQAGNVVDVEVSQKVQVGKAPIFTLIVNEAILGAQLALTAEGPGVARGPHRRRTGSVAGGTKVRWSLPAPAVPGTVRWQGTLTVRFSGGGQGEMPIAFQTLARGTFRFDIPAETLDFDAHTLVVVMDAPAGKVELTLTGDDGKLIANLGKTFHGEPPGTPLKITWRPRHVGPVLQIHAVAYDPDGFFSTADFFPHKVEVPHRDVVFDTASAEIRPSERAKLDEAAREIALAHKRYARAVKLGGRKIRLFVAGHTDTVGGAQSNLALSQRRAEAIARYFAKVAAPTAGAPLPIYARGFGESRLAVATDDETDEERNRRADYTLAIDPPTGGLGSWERIR